MDGFHLHLRSDRRVRHFEYHQAVLTESIDGVEPGIVIEVLQKGYLYKDRVIRPAMVKVSA